MKKTLLILGLVSFLGWGGEAVWADQTLPEQGEVEISTVSAQGSVTEDDLTIPKGEGDRLVEILESQKITGWWVSNVVKLSMRKAVSEGVSPNTLVLLFLFPLVAALVAFSRQVLGMSGFGMIVPALLSLAFVSTGGAVGLVLLLFVVSTAILGRTIMKKVRMPYLPKLAVLIWIVSVALLGLLIVSPTIDLKGLMTVGIFPIMIFVLLAETFVEAQITRSLITSVMMTAETVILALVAYKIVSNPWLQSQVLLYPERSMALILGIDVLIGRYKGLRLSEVWRFRKIVAK